MRIRCGWIAFGVLSLLGCGSAQPPAATAAPPPGFDTSLDMKKLMNWVVDPSAQVVWAAVGTIMTLEGKQEIAPRTDEDWSAVRNAAAMVVESGNLLLLPARARNQEDWPKKAQALIEAGREALMAAEVKDTEALFAAGGTVYQACAQCHAKYMVGAAEEARAASAQ